MENSFGTSSLCFKVGLLFVTLALILHAAGFSIPNFLEEISNAWEKSSSGLWQTCTEKLDDLTCEDSKFIESDWFLGVKVLQCIGLAATTLTTFISFALLLAVTNPWLSKANVAICFAALSAVGTSTILTVKMLRVTPDNPDHISRTLGLSFYLCIGATCFLLIACILFIVDLKKRNP